MTGVFELLILGIIYVFVDGVVIVEVFVVWVMVFVVFGCVVIECRNEGFEILGAFDKRALLSDWRERVFMLRFFVMIYFFGLFLDKYGLKDFDLMLCLWLVFVVDFVVGGVASLVVALCARSEFLIMN